MACVCGLYHTITLSNDGVVHSFGRNKENQLGLGPDNEAEYVSVPSPIPNLPKISQVSCGGNYTVCLDYEGSIWSFGLNMFGQLGTGNILNYNVPQQILNIPPVRYVACGSDHTLIITNDSNLWSCGNNTFGQLCLENKISHSTFQQTSFSDVSKISLGYYHSLIQTDKEEIQIHGCGCNSSGQLGLGYIYSPEITPTLVPHLPPNIIEFVSGYNHNLFLDLEGNVFCFGDNLFGQLGLGHEKNMDVVNQIKNIPPIQTIYCGGNSSYLIDFEGNVWSFGNNSFGQLGHGDKSHKDVPIKIECLKDIRQVPSGTFGSHFLAKDSQNTIFVVGSNMYGELGKPKIENIEALVTLEEFSPQYFAIWGESKVCRSKSARK